MNLRLFLPTGILIDEPVTKVIAEAENGYFCLLPRHVDFVAALTPGLLAFIDRDGREEFIAVDEGILVKNEDDVLVSVKDAVRGPELGVLKEAIQQRFRNLDEGERRARGALARLEADFIRRFIELEQ
jgi:F-type H+-transporting ATPase subunit epsilon